MPRYFFDTSALVKRYYYEPGSAWVRAVCESSVHPEIYISDLARVEVVSALRRAGQRDDLHPSFVDSMINTFERHLLRSNPSHKHPIYWLVPLSPGVLQLAATLCNAYSGREVHPLRSLDAMQLACAVAEVPNVSDEIVFVAADMRLAAVAEDEGFRVINPAFPPSQ